MADRLALVIGVNSYQAAGIRSLHCAEDDCLEMKLLLREAALETVPDLRAGDRLRLKLQGREGNWAMLQGWEEGHWETYFSGGLPADQWLPAGITITAEGQTRLRVVVCATAPNRGELDALLQRELCQQRVFEP